MAQSERAICSPALGRRHETSLAELAEFSRNHLGQRSMKAIRGTQLQNYVQSPLYQYGLLDESAFTVAPTELISVLRKECEQRGAVIAENMRVTTLARTGQNFRVYHYTGAITARHVVLARNAYTNIGFF